MKGAHSEYLCWKKGAEGSFDGGHLNEIDAFGYAKVKNYCLD